MAIVPDNNIYNLPSFEYADFSPGTLFYHTGNPISVQAGWSSVRVAAFIYNSNLIFVFASQERQPTVWVSGTGYQATIGIQNAFTDMGYTGYTSALQPGAIQTNTTDYPTTAWSINPTASSRMQQIAWLMLYGGYSGFSVTYDLENCTGSATNPTIIPPNATITPANFTPDDTFEFVSASCWIDGDGFPEGTPVLFVWEPETGALRIGVITSDITVHVHAYGDPYADIDGESDIPGGGSVSIPGLPGLSATSAGVIGLFAPSASQMQLLSDFMCLKK